MATKPQSKTAIDNAATFMKNDIDITPPANVNIRDAAIFFNPMRGLMTFNAEGSAATANAILTAVVASLNSQGRANTTTLLRRAADGEPERAIVINTQAIIYRIVNF